MKALAVALGMLLLTTQTVLAAPAAPHHLPHWAASLGSGLPHFVYRGSCTAGPVVEDQRTAEADAQISPEQPSPEAIHIAILVRRAEEELEHRATGGARQSSAGSTRTSPRD